jgi:hypothetical protein
MSWMAIDLFNDKPLDMGEVFCPFFYGSQQA